MKNVTRMLVAVIGMSVALSAGANEFWSDQVKSGLAGYKFGCSKANAGGTEVCGEMPSYQSMKRRQEREAAEAKRRLREEDDELAKEYPRYRNIPR